MNSRQVSLCVGIAVAVMGVVGVFVSWNRSKIATVLDLRKSEHKSRLPLADAEFDLLTRKCDLSLPSTTSELMHYWRLSVLRDKIDDVRRSGGRAIGEPITCAQVRSLFLDQSMFRDVFPSSPPWLRHGIVGLNVLQKNSHHYQTGEVHQDEFLATLAECSISLDEAILIASSRFTVRDLLAQAEYDYDVYDPPEFSSVAFAYYLAPAKGFYNKYGCYITFDSMVDSLTRSPLGEGFCGGTHVCYALAVLLKINAKSPVLSTGAAKRANDYLICATNRLAVAQHSDGAWRSDWHTGYPCALMARRLRLGAMPSC